jgi:hypothetical protein
MKRLALGISALAAAGWLLAGRVEAGGGAQSCRVATDCKGMLPHYIRRCSDGGWSGPIHWACERGACVSRNLCDAPEQH